MYGKESGEVRTQQMNYLDGLRRFRDKGVSVLVDGMECQIPTEAAAVWDKKIPSRPASRQQLTGGIFACTYFLLLFPGIL